MAVTAKLKYLRIAPRKVRLVADLIRGKSVEEAQTILHFTLKKAAQPLMKLLKSAIANAKNNFQLSEENLYVSKITVDEGPKYKRWMPRARGMASEIQKKTSHVTLILDEILKKPKKMKKIKKIKKVEEIKRVEEKIPKLEKPPKESKPPTGQAKFKPRAEIFKPKIEKGIKRIFRRKAF
jgi:large subunit ribosomal protein L22